MGKRVEYKPKWRVQLAQWLAWHMPREVVYWCGVRMAAYASQGKWSGEECTGVTVMEMIERWDD